MGFALFHQHMNQLMLNSSEATWRTSVSGIMGSTSLACWIVLLMPQLIEQWRLKSADGVSIGFISIWFLGDVFNLIGALWAGLLPEVIFLAVWFCIADAMMILSYFYYTRMYPKHHKVHHHGHEHHHHHHHHEHESNQVRDHEEDHAHHHHGEDAPLLRRRRSSTLTDIAIEPKYHSIFIKYVLPIFFVFGAGCLGYFLSDSKEPEEPSSNIEMGPQVMGYLSAVLYLGARIPQIIRNHQRKSVEGLSLLFFLFSTLGNITYASQIIFYRSDSQYIILNLSWLLGSLGTIFEDCFIFLQFYMYKDNIDKNEGVN